MLTRETGSGSVRLYVVPYECDAAGEDVARPFGFISGLFAKGGGYAALVERFETTAPPPGAVVGGQTVMMDRTVAYKYCVTFSATSAGLYMRVEAKVLKRHPAVLIPWSEVRGAEPVKLYWMPAMRLVIGEPRITQITVWTRLFESFRPYLDHVV
jgi:hypothetical protein